MKLFSRQHAERLDELIDGTGAAHDNDDPDLARLARIAQQLGQVKANASPDPQFKADLRLMLVATAEREGIGVTAKPGPPVRDFVVPRWTRAQRVAVSGFAAAVLVFSGAMAVSGDAMPGDTLYGVKRTGERAQLIMASGSPYQRGQLRLTLAENRAAEAAEMQGDQRQVMALLDEADAETREAVKAVMESAVDRREPGRLDVVDAFVDQQYRTINGMLARLSGDAYLRASASAQLLAAVKQRGQALRGALRCGGMAPRGSDELGPLPGRCMAQEKLQPATDGGAATPNTGGGQEQVGAQTGRSPKQKPPTGGSGAGVTQPPPMAPPAEAPPTAPPQPAKPPARGGGADSTLVDRIGRLLGG